MKTYLFRKTVTDQTGTAELFRATSAPDGQTHSAREKTECFIGWEVVSASGKFASFSSFTPAPDPGIADELASLREFKKETCRLAHQVAPLHDLGAPARRARQPEPPFENKDATPEEEARLRDENYRSLITIAQQVIRCVRSDRPEGQHALEDLDNALQPFR